MVEVTFKRQLATVDDFFGDREFLVGSSFPPLPAGGWAVIPVSFLLTHN